MKLIALLLFISITALYPQSVFADTISNHTVSTAEGTRSFILQRPAQKTETPQPVVLIAHGGGGSAKYMIKKSQEITRKLNAAGYIVVFMDGTAKHKIGNKKTWNADHCCAHAQEKNIDEVAYYNATIDALSNIANINPQQVFLMGHSNGAMLTYRIANKLDVKPKGIIAISGAMFHDQPTLPKRTSVFLMHAANDKIISIDGSGPDKSEKHRTAPNLSFSKTARTILNQKNCHISWTKQDKPHRNSVSQTRFSCKFGAIVDVIESPKGGHRWPMKIRGYSLDDKIISFLRSNQ